MNECVIDIPSGRDYFDRRDRVDFDETASMRNTPGSAEKSLPPDCPATERKPDGRRSALRRPTASERMISPRRDAVSLVV
jgi:hypothetical protein